MYNDLLSLKYFHPIEHFDAFLKNYVNYVVKRSSKVMCFYHFF